MLLSKINVMQPSRDCGRGDLSSRGCWGRGGSGAAVDDGPVSAVDLVVVVADEEDVVEERRRGTEGARFVERRAPVDALRTCGSTTLLEDIFNPERVVQYRVTMVVRH